MGSVSRHGRVSEGGERRHYVASMIWPGHLPRPANDNHCGVRLDALISLAASAMLLAAAVWAVVS